MSHKELFYDIIHKKLMQILQKKDLTILLNKKFEVHLSTKMSNNNVN